VSFRALPKNDDSWKDSIEFKEKEMNPNLKEPQYLRTGKVIRDVTQPEETRDKTYPSISAAKKASRELQGTKRGDGTLKVIR
jgi:hypothetical protein